VKRWRLSDSDWHTILVAVRPLRKGARLARARRELAKCLRDYPAIRRDRVKLRAAQTRWQRIDKLATDLYAILAEEWWQKRWRYNPLIDDAFKRYLLPSAKVITETFAMQMRLRKGKLDPGRDWLYLSLLDIWINQFHGELKASTSATGGPCVRFVRTAMALVLPPDQVPRVPAVRRTVRALGRGRVLGQFRYDPVVGAQRHGAGRDQSSRKNNC
jgi:hypothetical protein